MNNLFVRQEFTIFEFIPRYGLSNIITGEQFGHFNYIWIVSYLAL